MHDKDPYANRIGFYSDTISRWIPDRNASVLVVGGGSNDRHVFESLGFRRVTMTNVDSVVLRTAADAAALAAADAENLPYPDESFDYTVVHAVLHHCQSPHRAMLELYRVAAKAAIFFESRDSLSLRLVEWLRLGNNYEISAVKANGGVSGGLRDTAIPNYVYRWTEREVEKTIASNAPFAKHAFDYAYGYGTPCRSNSRSFLRGVLLGIYRLFVTFFPSQRNLFACRIRKPTLPRDLQPWLAIEDGRLILKQS